MSRKYTAIACAALLATMAACGGSNGSTSARPASPVAAPDAKRVDVSTASTITGKVVLEGTPPPNPNITMLADPVCASLNKGNVTSEAFVVDNGRLANVFVYIKDGLDNKYVFDIPTEPVTLNQKDCHYVPHVGGVRVAQPFDITNSDDTLHNVHAMPDRNLEFNMGQPVPGLKNTVTFTAPEVMIPFKCDVHKWMNAYIGVVDHPYFAVSGRGGTFELKTIPPGTYTIEAWHEKLGRQTQTVTLGAKDAKEITFTFKVQG